MTSSSHGTTIANMSIRKALTSFMLVSTLVLVTAFSVMFIASTASSDEDRVNRAREGRVPDQYIVVFNDAVTDLDREEEEIIGRLHGERIDSYRHALRGFAARLSPEAVAELARDSRVAFISEDRVVSITATRVSSQGDVLRRTDAERDASILSRINSHRRESDLASTAISQTLPTGIDRINAEGKANKGAGVHVAVIDTGIQTDHPDLINNIAGGKNCSSGTSYIDGNGHGTHVAGTIAALNNSQGVVGVAPEAKLWAVRVLNNSGSGTWSSVICGLDFVASKGPANGGPITVANMSLGGGGASDNNCGN